MKGSRTLTIWNGVLVSTKCCTGALNMITAATRAVKPSWHATMPYTCARREANSRHRLTTRNITHPMSPQASKGLVVLCCLMMEMQESLKWHGAVSMLTLGASL